MFTHCVGQGFCSLKSIYIVQMKYYKYNSFGFTNSKVLYISLLKFLHILFIPEMFPNIPYLLL